MASSTPTADSNVVVVACRVECAAQIWFHVLKVFDFFSIFRMCVMYVSRRDPHFRRRMGGD